MRHPWPLLVFAVVLACGGRDEGPASPRGTQYTFNDPRGDTLASELAVDRAHDVLHVGAAARGDTLVVAMQFAEIVQPNSTRASNAVLGIIDFDLDDDPSTGVHAIADDFGGTSHIGADWSLVLDDSTAGPADRRVAMVNLATNAVARVPVSYDGSTVVARIPLALLHARAQAHVRMVSVFGSMERASDIAPNEGSLEFELP